MRKHLSVLMLIARSTIYKILALFLLIASTEYFLFSISLKSALVAANAGLGMATLESVISDSRIDWAFAVCLVIMAVLLCMTGYESGSKQGYTLRRLSISERSVFMWQCIYNTFCFFILWAVQTMIAYTLCKLYLAKVDPGLTSVQTVFLAFYRNDFLHSILPLSEVSRWIRNILLFMCLGIGAAHFPFMQRRGKVGVTIIAMTALSLVFFSRGIGIGSLGNDFLVISLSIINIVAILNKVLGRHAYEEA